MHADRCRLAILAMIVMVLSGEAGERVHLAIVESSISEIHKAYRTGEFTSEQLVKSYLQRLRHYDDSTTLNSMVVLNGKALERARQLDKQFQKTGKLLPLHGIPVIVKDNYDTRDLQTAAGSSLLKGSLPPDDAFQIRRLREAGAIVLGKSNMAEWAYSANFTISSIGGTTRNPYDLSRVPAGSSGGTAAAVAANLGAVGLGTDTGNSIRGPSAHCCLVGIRPTLGLTSRDGIVPLFLRNDTGGPICRTVEDAARVLEVIAGFDPKDPVTSKAKGKSFDYVSKLNKDALRGARIGVFRTLSESATANQEIRQRFKAAVLDIKRLGAEVIDPFEVPGLDAAALGRLQGTLWFDTFAHDIEQYLNSLGEKAPVDNIKDILRGREYGNFLRNRLTNSQNARLSRSLKQPYSADVEYDPQRLELLRRIVKAMDDQRVDAFVFPTWNNPPRRLGDTRSPAGNNSYQIPPHTGQPAITVPMGFTTSGLPTGLQWIGRPFSEAKLFQLAYAYEQGTLHRKPPTGFPELGSQPINVRVAAVSFRPKKLDLKANAAKLEKLFRRAARGGAKLAVAPEGALDGYIVNEIIAGKLTAEQMRSVAIPLDSPTIQRFKLLARELGMCLAFGFAEEIDSNVFNTAIFIDDDGQVAGKYHKMQFAEGYDEKWWFNRLGKSSRAFETPFGRGAFLICNDRWNPALARIPKLDGAQFLMIPAFGSRGRSQDEAVLGRGKETGLPIVEANVGVTLIVDQNEIAKVERKEETVTFSEIKIPARQPVDATRRDEVEQTFLRWRKTEMIKRLNKTQERVKRQQQKPKGDAEK